MKRAYPLLTVLAFCCLIWTSGAEADSQPPPEGGVLPDFVLAAPSSLDYQQYLGISGKDVFKITEIKAQVVILELFNMY